MTPEEILKQVEEALLLSEESAVLGCCCEDTNDMCSQCVVWNSARSALANLRKLKVVDGESIPDGPGRTWTRQILAFLQATGRIVIEVKDENHDPS